MRNRSLGEVSHEHVDLMDIINGGVNIERFLTHVKGKSFDPNLPPPIVLENSKSCAQFSDLISTTIWQWVLAGVLSVWGEIGQVSLPYLVLPLTVEPSKPCLCHDKRYLNLWIKDLPFRLNHLSDLPRYVLPGHYQTTFNEKSGYSTFTYILCSLLVEAGYFVNMSKSQSRSSHFLASSVIPFGKLS